MGGYQYKIDPERREKKILLKYIAIFRNVNSVKRTGARIAVLTEDNLFAEFNMILVSPNSISHVTAYRIRRLFEPFKITDKTEVVFNEGYDRRSPLYLYFLFLLQQINFNMRFVKTGPILRLISRHHGYFEDHKRMEINKYFLNRLWDNLVREKRCPWITEEVDEHFKTLKHCNRQERKLLRVTMYYLLIKSVHQKYLHEYWKKRTLQSLEQIKLQQAQLPSCGESQSSIISAE